MCTGRPGWQGWPALTHVVLTAARIWSLLTYCLDEALEESEGKQRLWQLAEKHLERAGDDVDVFPLAGVQVEFLLWEENTRQAGDRREDRGNNTALIGRISRG